LEVHLRTPQHSIVEAELQVVNQKLTFEEVQFPKKKYCVI
jgi:hypothetical protein